jgi:hypothetical protein
MIIVGADEPVAVFPFVSVFPSIRPAKRSPAKLGNGGDVSERETRIIEDPNKLAFGYE